MGAINGILMGVYAVVLIYYFYLHFIINIKNVKIIFNLGIKTVLYLKYNRINGLVGVYNGKAEQPA